MIDGEIQDREKFPIWIWPTHPPPLVATLDFKQNGTTICTLFKPTQAAYGHIVIMLSKNDESNITPLLAEPAI